MRGVVAAIVILLAIDAAHAHCYSIWHYPQRQNCHATALAPASIRSRARIDIVLPAPRPIEFSLPSLTDIDWGNPPTDELRSRLLLLGVFLGKEDK